MIKHFTNYADQRFNGQCVYCGAAPETREHVPPKVFLDRPYPDNLPIVEACAECSNGYSMDEQYMACLIDCVISGTSDPKDVQRTATKKALNHSSALAEKLNVAKKLIDGGTVFNVEYDHIESIVTKIAIGHILYELNLIAKREDFFVSIAPLVSMIDREVSEFESIGNGEMAPWPEVGSRAMQRFVENDDNYKNGWVIVQAGRYRYAVIQSEIVEVRMVFSEYLACKVVWEDAG